MWRKLRLTRDVIVATIALALLVYEVLGDGRAAVLTALTALLLSPLVMRADEARRLGQGSSNESSTSGK